MQTNIIYNKSCLTMEEIEDNSIDTIITSCPYWGLRDYGKGANQIWGGDSECKHEWGKSIPRKYHKAGETNPGKEGYTKNAGAWGQTSGQFCQLCGAWYGQLGLEPTLEMYIEHLLLITAECKRVLKPTGVMWWNHGDCYGGNNSRASSGGRASFGTPKEGVFNIPVTPKCLALQNYRLIIRLIDEQGWILRNDVKWYKPNSMPSSTKDRLTNKYEPVFFLVKNTKTQYYWNDKTGLMANRKSSPLQENIDWEWIKCPKCEGKGKIDDKICPRCKGTRKIKHSFWHSLDYWFDLDAIRESHKDIQDYQRHAPFNYRVGEAKKGHTGIIGVKSTKEEMARYDRKGIRVPGQLPQGIHRKRHSGYYGPNGECLVSPLGKNPGDVWTIPTQPYPEAHFATFPEKLIIKPILSSCPAEVCRKCGKARVRITKPTKEYAQYLGRGYINKEQEIKTAKKEGKVGSASRIETYMDNKPVSTTADYQTIGWTDCGCNAGWHPGIVLDPFAGRGTTLAMSKRFDRQFIGYEIVKSYIPLIRKSLEKEDTMFNRDLKEIFQ